MTFSVSGQITISVTLPSGSNKTFNMISTEKIQSLIKKIKPQGGKDKKGWKFVFKDIPLNNEDTFNEKGIKSGSILKLLDGGSKADQRNKTGIFNVSDIRG